MILKYFAFLLVLNKTDANKSNKEPIDKTNAQKFIDSLNKSDWHITELKDDGFEKSDEEINMFTTKHNENSPNMDAGIIQFVSGDVINVGNMELESAKSLINVTISKNLSTKRKKLKHSARDKDLTNSNITFKGTPLPERKTLKKVKAARRGEYMFSSEEYYDEKLDTEPPECPDLMQVIVLQLDQLRNYDIECEKITEWKSLLQ